MSDPVKDKLDIMIIGAEEYWEAAGLGTRGPLLERALARSEHVSKVLVINNPHSFVGRIKDRIYGMRCIDAVYPPIRKGWRWSLVNVIPKLFMLNTTLFMPETDRDKPAFEVSWMLHLIDRIKGDLEMNDPILLISNPRAVNIAKHIDARVRIFDTEDNLLLHPQNRRFYGNIKKGYTWAGNNADIIFLLSDRQRVMYPAHAAPRFFIMPNGVDDIFLRKDTRVPPDINSIKRPQAIYVGVLQERMDVELMERVIRSLPEYSFIFVGPEIVKSYFDPLKSMQNVRFLGFKDYKSMPAYINSADVCIIPHKVNRFTDSQNPLKIYEYLACGKPVVSTSVAGTDDFKGHIYLADDAVSFADSIRRVVAENSGLREKERREAARQNTWDIRIENMIHVMNRMSHE